MPDTHPAAGYDDAVAAYHQAANLLQEAVRAEAARLTLAAYPTAHILHIVGWYGEEGTLSVQARGVVDAEGDLLGGSDVAPEWLENDPLEGAENHTDEWDDLTDELNEPLFWLELYGDDYLRYNEIEVNNP